MRTRDNDIAIAEKIFGFPVEEREVWVYSEFGDHTVERLQMLIEVYDDGSGGWWEDLPEFDSDIVAAWRLVEKLANQGYSIRLSNKSQDNDFWWCYIDDKFCQQETTAPMAIAECALKLPVNSITTKEMNILKEKWQAYEKEQEEWKRRNR